MIENLYKKRIISVFGILAVLALSFGLVIRLKYGFDPTDESYYYALAKRFYQGDIPFIDEWYPSQIYAVLLMPFYVLYTFVVPSGDGIILAGRYIYLIIQIIVSLFSLYVFRGSKHRAIVITVLYMMCTRQNIPGLSYYNLYLTSCFVISILAYDYLKYERSSYFVFCMIGASCSVATLCMPYFASLAVVLMVILAIKKKNKELSALVGSIMLCALAYLTFLLSKASLADYISSIGYVLSNPDYADLSIVKKIIGTVLSIGKICVVCVPGFVYLIISKNEKRNDICIAISLLVGGIIFGFTTPGAIFIQTAFLALPYMIRIALSGNLDFEKKIGIFLYFLGYAFAFLFWLGSDTEASCLPLGLLISVIGFVIAIYGKNSEMYTAICILLCVSAISARLVGPCYRDARIWSLGSKIEEGPAKGIYTEESDKEDYNAALELIRQVNTENSIEKGTEKKILISKFLPWAYLATDCRNASMTPWRSAIADARLQMYYDANPQQFPDIIVVFSENTGETNGLSGGEKMNASNLKEGKLWNKMEASEKIISSKAGTAYILRN